MKTQEIILVDEQDRPMGTMEKMEAHRLGVLHRAFSVFIFDSRGRMLIQQRAAVKYHGALLWTNACCSHPHPGETTLEAAERRLKEELGFTTALEEIFSFTYLSHVENGLIEHEYDHVFAGEYEGPLQPDQQEVAEYTFEEMKQLEWAIKNQPSRFTTWFRIAFPKIEAWWKGKYQLAN